MADENKAVIEETVTEQPEQTAVTTDKSSKPQKKKAKKPGLFARIGKWFRDLRSEAKKVIWPGKKQVFNNTIVVIVAVIVVAAIVAALDITFGFVRDFLASLTALIS